MTQEERDRIVIVLVRARNPANIGAAARAMHDFGFRHLRVVNAYPIPFEAARSAVNASSVLLAAQQPAGVAEAVADCTLVLGTTALGERVLQHPLHTLEAAAGVIERTLAQQESGRVALLFGSEKTGLSNDELSHCHALLTIPMNPVESSGDQQHLSMNLGQAVAVCLYALAQLQATRTVPQEPPASAGDTERVTTLLRDLMETSGYARRHPANAREASIRRLVYRMHPSATDAAVWTGIFRQAVRRLSSASPERSNEHAAEGDL